MILDALLHREGNSWVGVSEIAQDVGVPPPRVAEACAYWRHHGLLQYDAGSQAARFEDSAHEALMSVGAEDAV